jgi:CDP-paratose 2-epimerase
MHILVTGGAGFIGSNIVRYYLNLGHDVTILDNFSRLGSRENIQWVIKQSKNKPKIIEANLIYDKTKIQLAVKKVDLIIHLAAQVAVTTSIKNPIQDFENNVIGTINLLEAVRLSVSKPVFIYSSTNKVYGGLENVAIVENKTRFVFKNLPYGISETQTLDFHTPYGCSKGAADQYVNDYGRIYGINTIVFRQSCIYGPHQFGIEDQGWIAWFIIALIKNKAITIYGNGKQVRDLLYIDDLISAYDTAFKNAKKLTSRIFNVGGGPKNTISVWIELKPLLEKLFQRSITARVMPARLGDQPIYISDIRKAKDILNWEPKITIEEGVGELFRWVQKNKNLF